MEIHFQQQPDDESLNYATMIPLPSKASKFKGRNKANGNNGNKYVGVRQRPSGRWVAEIKDTTQKIRMWLGTFQTAEEAARAYDEAACLLRGKNTKTNFVTPFVSHDSPLASRINNILNKRKNNSSPPRQHKHKTPPTTPNSTTSSYDATSNDHNSNSSKSSSPSFSYTSSDEKTFDDAYKPDFSNFIKSVNLDEKDDHHQQTSLSSWRKFQLQVLQGGFEFDHHGLELPKIEPEGEFSEFERMKVERQISASLYAMNGVHEYMEAVVCDDPFWDLPPF